MSNQTGRIARPADARGMVNNGVKKANTGSARPPDPKGSGGSSANGGDKKK